MADDWYRSDTWNPDIAARFEMKLGRAKKKDQYLRLQAASLVENYPDIALLLVKRYFELEDPFAPAIAFDVKAQALVRLERLEEAVQAYEEALKTEEAFPNIKTNAFAHMAELVVTHGFTDRYTRVLEVLQMRKDMLVFRVLAFIYHACRSIIFKWQHKVDEATAERDLALKFAARRATELQYHSGVGLVGPLQAPLLRLVQGFRDA